MLVGNGTVPGVTPVQRAGPYWVKRDDLYTIAGVSGGKARTCYALAKAAKGGLVTASARDSPQAVIVSHIAKYLDLPCRVHMPTGRYTHQMLLARDAGAEIVQHRAGYNTVIVARAREDAAQLKWTEIPFGMQHREAVRQTATQVANLPAGVTRVVVPVGSGMTLAGVLHGIDQFYPDKKIRVVGVTVGADPLKRLAMFAPMNWKRRVTLIQAPQPYHTSGPVNNLHGVPLDPIYESKAVAYLQPDDCFWIVGIRMGV